MKHRNFIRTTIVAAAVTFFVSVTAALQVVGQDTAWVSLFDGTTLNGWENPYDWGEAWVEDGEIRLRADRKFFLMSDRPYRDFIFEAEILMPEGEANSGFMFRAHKEKNRVYGYQAEVDPSERMWAGGLYDEGRRGWLHPKQNDEAAGSRFRETAGTAFDRTQWNKYRIEAIGDSIRIFVNDQLTTEYVDNMDREGYIGIQHHGEQGKVYRFRNLRIGEIESPAENFLDESEFARNLRMDWWRDARFGMFIHWGLYAIPAGTWNGQQINGIGEWIMATANIPVEEYEPLAGRFNPQDFDAAEWVRIAQEAGMKYLVITSKHHDGFALWDSRVSDYDVVDATPFGRDILAELSEECRKQGVRFGVYHSILDWHHPSQFVDPDAENPRAGHARNKMHEGQKDEYVQYMKAQLKEIITNYDPWILWFDGEWAPWWTEEDGKDLYNYVRSLKEDIIINNRIGKGRMGMAGLNRGPGYAGDFGTPEQEIPDTGQPGVDWESCMTMNDSWGFKSFDDNWKSTDTLIHHIIDTASKGGNYLLNVGPTAEGVIPEPSVERLAGIGEWMKINGESIYMTTASPFSQPAWGRYTKREPGTLYVHVFDWPSNQKLNLPAIAAEVTRAVVLTPEGARSVSVDQSSSGIILTIPRQAPNPVASVIKLEFANKW